MNFQFDFSGLHFKDAIIAIGDATVIFSFFFWLIKRALIRHHFLL